MKEFRLKLEKVFDFLGEIIAFLTIAIWAVVIIDTNFGFLPTTLRSIFEISRYWSLLILVAIEGFECTIKRNIVIRLIFYKTRIFDYTHQQYFRLQISERKMNYLFQRLLRH